MVNAPGKVFLLVTGILFILFGTIALFILAPLSLLTVLAWMPKAAEVMETTGVDMTLLLISTVFMFPAGIFYIVAGILAVMNRNRPEKSTSLIVFALIIIVLQFVSMALSLMMGDLSSSSFFGFIVPVLLLAGGLLNRKARTDLSFNGK